MPLYSWNISTVCLPRSVSCSVHLKCALFLGLISTCCRHTCVIISFFRSLNLSLSFHQSASLLLTFLFYILVVSIKHRLHLVLYSFQLHFDYMLMNSKWKVDDGNLSGNGDQDFVFVFWCVALHAFYYMIGLYLVTFFSFFKKKIKLFRRKAAKHNIYSENNLCL